MKSIEIGLKVRQGVMGVPAMCSLGSLEENTHYTHNIYTCVLPEEEIPDLSQNTHYPQVKSCGR